jgi:RHS repeat-associated protein
VSPRLVQTYAYDGLDRLKGAHTYAAGAQTDSGQWAYDARGRQTSEAETHAAAGINRTQSFEYVGLSVSLGKETWTGSGATSKSYRYDAAGAKLSVSDSASAKDVLYGYNPRGDVSQLLDAQLGTAAATYGYQAYGQEEAAGSGSLSQGDTDLRSPLNSYRFNAMRYDAGAGAINMGARFYGPQYGSFLQQDYYRGALDDVQLASDPLTGTRYGFAGANPINFVETDGHVPVPSGRRLQAPNYWRYDKTLRYIYSEMRANARSWIVDVVGDYQNHGFFKRAAWQAALHNPTTAVTAHELKAAAWAALINKFRQGGDWDHKPKLRKMLKLDPPGTLRDDYYFPIRGVRGKEVYYDIWSNIHYGYVGKAAGISEFTLQSAAWLESRTDAGDKISTHLGAQLWEQHGLHLTPQDLARGVRGTIPVYERAQRSDRRLRVVIPAKNNR